jgi:hypothetical protein
MAVSARKWMGTYGIGFAAVLSLVLLAGDLSASQVVTIAAEEEPAWLWCLACAITFGAAAYCCLLQLQAFLASPAGQLARIGCALECAKWLLD